MGLASIINALPLPQAVLLKCHPFLTKICDVITGG